MLFKRKYIFETKKTRTKRYFLNSILSLFILFICYISFSLYLFHVGSKETQLAKNTFYQKSPDLIVVFTGDTGRIPLAIDLFKKYDTAKVFITGVNARNTVDHLLKLIGRYDDPTINAQQIEIDYLARNTIENAFSTLRFLHQNKELRKILLISSDYHIYRIKQIIHTLFGKQKHFQFYFYGTQADLKQTRSHRLIIKETYKIIKALAFLALWSSDTPSLVW